ncbi:Uracil-DNA glycosylase [Bienertia sinuspersici]
MHHQQIVEASTEHESTSPGLTNRQKRRLEQRRGPTTGKKYGPRMWNSNSEEKIKINFMDELRRAVSKKVDEFICDCSNWGKYDLLEKVVGADITEALSFQCSMFNKSVADAINSRPSTIDLGPWTWLVYEYWNNEKQKLKQIETPTNGARHNGIGWEPNVEKDYEVLKSFHEKEIGKHREDTLSVKDAYMKVFKEKSGYVKRLGRRARPPKKCRVKGESNEAMVYLSLEIPKLKDDAAAREASLASEIETLKASNVELKNSNKELKTSDE